MGCEIVVCESTSDYWMQVYDPLAGQVGVHRHSGSHTPIEGGGRPLTPPLTVLEVIPVYR